MELDREMETYQRELPRLLEEGREGQFVLIHGDQVDSCWETDEQAYEAGCQRFGLAPFLVQRVQRTEPVLFSTVDVIP
jgi:hypothetical protein